MPKHRFDEAWTGTGWPDAKTLFPSFTGEEDGYLPALPDHGPVWQLLDPDGSNSLKAQMGTLSGEIACENPGFFTRGEGIVIDATATVEAGASLIGPCYVGPRAVVRSGAYVREHSWILRGCRGRSCNGSQTFHSLAGRQGTALQLRRRFHSGKGANLGAGTKLSNLRNDGGEVHVRLNGERLPSGLRKFGAVLGEGVATGCNSVTNPGVVLGCNSTVWPNATVTGIHGPDSQHR